MALGTSLLGYAAALILLIKSAAAVDALRCADQGHCEPAEADEELGLLQSKTAVKQVQEHVQPNFGPAVGAPNFGLGSPDIPIGSIPVHKKCSSPPCSEQVHIQLGGPGEMVISFASNHSKRTQPKVSYGAPGGKLNQTAYGYSKSHTLLMYWSLDLWGPQMGVPGLTPAEVAAIMDTTSWAKDPYGYKYTGWHEVTAEEIEKAGYPGLMGKYKNPAENYNSPMLHTVTLRDLVDGQTYAYSVADDDRVFQFTMPKASFPFTLGLTADVGQTQVSNVTFQTLREMKPDVVLLAGDVSYADGYFPRWDSYERLAEQLGSRVPIMTCPGDHEQFMMEGYVSYRERHPMPSSPSGSTDSLYWARDIGPVHVISLNSYGGTAPGTAQYEWLVDSLKYNFDRARTPWLIVMMHVPWYNSNVVHRGEAVLMQGHMEDLLFSYGVNLVLSGHTHSFEHAGPAYQNKTNSCGPIYLGLGDGGNREGTRAFGRPLSAHPGLWLPGLNATRPEWTVFRQNTYGAGQLDLLNATHARFRWTKKACWNNSTATHEDFSPDCVSAQDNSVDTVPVHEFVLARPSHTTCDNQAAKPPTATTPAPGSHVKCTHSETMCAGSQCCPGAEATGGKTYPCPSADPGWTSCEVA